MAYRDVKPKVEDGSSEQGDASTAPSPLSVASAGGAGSQSTYTDYVLRASPATDGRDGWRYNVMKLASVGDKQVDFAGQDWAKPVKLNRKDPRFVRRQIEEDRLRRRNAALGKDESGDTIMGDENGGDSDASDVKGKGKEKEVMDPSLVGRGLTGESAAARNKRKPFKKKTKRVYVTSEEQRRVRRQEFAPWMLEDAKGDERWVGRLEGGAGDASQRKMNESAASSRTGTKGWRPEAKASESGGGGSSYVFFVFGENGEDFQIVPANRWYKFTSEPKYEIFDNEEAEAQYTRQQRHDADPERWIMASRNAAAAAAAAKREGTHERLLQKSRAKCESSEDAPSHARMRSVIKNDDYDDAEDDEQGAQRRRARPSQEQSDDEFEFEEEFADDEEGIAKIDDMADEEETKELEERIKREMRAVERADQGEEDEAAGADAAALTSTGREMRKLVKKFEKTDVYESADEDDDNPYVSSEDEDDETDQADKKSTASTTSVPVPDARASTTTSRYPSAETSRVGSRVGSPAPSGSAYLARRATSPRPATSPHSMRRSTHERSKSPLPGKRKRPDGDHADSDGKRRRPTSPSPSRSPGGTPTPGDGNLITEADVAAFLRGKAGVTTKDVLVHFKRALRADERNKQAISKLLQAVSRLEGGKIVLKEGL